MSEIEVKFRYWQKGKGWSYHKEAIPTRYKRLCKGIYKDAFNTLLELGYKDTYTEFIDDDALDISFTGYRIIYVD